MIFKHPDRVFAGKTISTLRLERGYHSFDAAGGILWRFNVNTQVSFPEWVVDDQYPVYNISGRRYGMVRITSLERMSFADLTDDMARDCGYSDADNARAVLCRRWHNPHVYLIGVTPATPMLSPAPVKLEYDLSTLIRRSNVIAGAA